jgi:hypothetical protein
MLLNRKWVKATPAFNLTLCEKFDVKPLEFDGKEDSIFHEFDQKGNRHMEYVRDHGQFSDLPYQQIVAAFKEHYPILFSKDSTNIHGNFEEEALSEK